MKTAFLALALLIGSVSCVPAFAQGTLSAPNSQQNRMTQCNQDAVGKTGDDRKNFMKSCLSSKPQPMKMTQQQRMTACNQQATGKTGDDRKNFMKSCLSNKN